MKESNWKTETTSEENEFKTIFSKNDYMLLLSWSLPPKCTAKNISYFSEELILCYEREGLTSWG